MVTHWSLIVIFPEISVLGVLRSLSEYDWWFWAPDSIISIRTEVSWCSCTLSCDYFGWIFFLIVRVISDLAPDCSFFHGEGQNLWLSLQTLISQNLVADIWNLKSEVCNLKLKSEIWDPRFEIWDLKSEIWDLSSNFRVRVLCSWSILIWLSKYSYNPLFNSNSSF